MLSWLQGHRNPWYGPQWPTWQLDEGHHGNEEIRNSHQQSSGLQKSEKMNHRSWVSTYQSLSLRKSRLKVMHVLFSKEIIEESLYLLPMVSGHPCIYIHIICIQKQLKTYIHTHRESINMMNQYEKIYVQTSSTKPYYWLDAHISYIPLSHLRFGPSSCIHWWPPAQMETMVDGTIQRASFLVPGFCHKCFWILMNSCENQEANDSKIRYMYIYICMHRYSNVNT